MQNILNSIINNIPENKNEGDYYENGILMCGKCHTHKQIEIELFGEKRIVPCICKCEKEKQRLKKLEEKEEQNKSRIDTFRNKAFGANNPMSEWTFANDDGANELLTKRAKKYSEKFDEFLKDGKGLLLYGNTGTGKTYIACCIANAVIETKHSVKVTNLADISNEIFNAEDKNEYMQLFEKLDLLVIDDLGIERNTPYMNEILYSVIDTRYRCGKPMIITTNLTAKQLREPRDIEQQRILSRIKERCIALEVKGEDRRIEIAKRQYADDLALLDE